MTIRHRTIQSNIRCSSINTQEPAKIRSKQYYDRKANPQLFNKDYIYLLKEPLRGKFDEQYKESYKILEILGNNNIKLAISDKRTRIVHSDKLKVCRTNQPSRHNPTSPSRRRHLHYFTTLGPIPPSPRANGPST